MVGPNHQIVKVDVTGLICPVPVREVRRRLERMEPGEELVVVGDYPPAEDSIRRACLTHGFDVCEESTDGEPDEFALRIRVTELSSLGSS